MLTKLVAAVLKKYDIYHTSSISIIINQKRMQNAFIFSLRFWNNNYSSPLQNSLS
jgi:hypothetical protein